MTNSIHKTYLKGEKAFEKGEFLTAKKHLLSVVNHDRNYYAAYLLLFKIEDKNNSSLKKISFEELKHKFENPIRVGFYCFSSSLSCYFFGVRCGFSPLLL